MVALERCNTELKRLRHPLPPTVVVVGEISKGKTTLINALVGYPDLLPVDIDVATGSYVRVAYAETASASVFGFGEGQPTPIDLAEIAEWVSIGGNPDNRKQVRFAEVSIPSPLLRSGIDIIDTPGVSVVRLGAHSELTMSVLEQADALLFVCDVLTPLTTQEVEFLRSATSAVPVIRVVVNKIDVIADAQEIVGENLRILNQQVPAVADHEVLPTSARAAERLLRRGTALEEAADGKTDLTGVLAVRKVLADEITRERDALRFALANTVASDIASSLAKLLAGTVEMYESLDACRRQIDERQEELKRLRMVEISWEDALREQVALLVRQTGIKFRTTLQTFAGKSSGTSRPTGAGSAWPPSATRLNRS